VRTAVLVERALVKLAPWSVLGLAVALLIGAVDEFLTYLRFYVRHSPHPFLLAAAEARSAADVPLTPSTGPLPCTLRPLPSSRPRRLAQIVTRRERSLGDATPPTMIVSSPTQSRLTTAFRQPSAPSRTY
jgi:hypothetical protein